MTLRREAHEVLKYEANTEAAAAAQEAGEEKRRQFQEFCAKCADVQEHDEKWEKEVWKWVEKKVMEHKKTSELRLVSKKESQSIEYPLKAGVQGLQNRVIQNAPYPNVPFVSRAIGVIVFSFV